MLNWFRIKTLYLIQELNEGENNMVKKTEERKDMNEENKDIFKTWVDSYTTVSKTWEDSYLKLYKPWLEATGEMFEKAALLSKDAAPEQYKEFYEEWMKTYQNTFGKFHPIPTLKSSKETLEKLLKSAEESNRLYSSWIAELEENSRKTREILQGNQDPAKYKEAYELWVKSHEKIFDEFIAYSSKENMKDIFGYEGIPDFYSETFVQISKLWKDSHAKLYEPWNEFSLKLSDKVSELSKGNASPEDYKEFYDLWIATFKETFGSQPSKEIFENFVQNTRIHLNMFKSWIAALEKLSERAREISKQTTDPEASKEFYELWVKTYEKAFESFFENTPTSGPMKEILAPVRSAAKIYADTFTRTSRMWMKAFSTGSV